MIRKFVLPVFCVVVLIAMAACSKQETETAQSDKSAATTDMAGAETDGGSQMKEPDYVSVQHILVGFEGSVPGKPITRTKAEAQELANELFKRAQGGEDFDALVKEYTDDAHPGIYKMANRGVPGNPAQKVYERDGMVAAFGDVGFPLDVGGIGLAEYDPAKSKYGWHIIKRVE